MSDHRNQYRINPLLYLAPAAAIVAVMWGWYLLERLSDLRLVRAGGTAHNEPVPLIFTIIVSLVVPLVAFIMYRRAKALLDNSVPVTAKIESLGRAGGSVRQVVFTYTFEGRSYTRKMGVSNLRAEGLAPGNDLPILVDRRNPKTVLVR